MCPGILQTEFDIRWRTIEMKYDYIVVGAGLAGGILARKLAESGKRILIVERRKAKRSLKRINNMPQNLKI